MNSKSKKYLYQLLINLTFIFVSIAVAQQHPDEPKFFPEEGNDTIEEQSATDVYHVEQLQDSMDEDLDEEEYIETTIFDLYVSDKRYGAIVTNYTEQWFEITSVDDALDQLPLLKESEKFRELLTGRIPRERNISGLGKLSYDLDTFQIILVPSVDKMQGSELGLKDRIPDPENKPALSQRVRVAASGNIEDSIRTSVTHRSLGSVGKYWSRVDGTLINDEDYQLTELALGGIVSTTSLMGGLLETQGSLFASSADMLGFSASTAEDIFLDREVLRGSKLEVFVPSRSRVDFFRGQRLLGSQILDFGLQEVNTRYFPEGSYDVDIVIREDNGTITREKKFFTKSGLLAIRSRPVWSVSGGWLRDRLTVLDTPVFDANVRWRAASILQLEGGVYGTSEDLIYTARSLGFWRDYLLDASVSYSDQGDLGYRVSFSGLVGPVGFSFGVSETTGEEDVEFTEEENEAQNVDPITSEVADSTKRETKEETEQRILDAINRLDEKSSTYSGSITAYFEPVKVQFSGNHTENGGQEARYSIGPSLEWTIFNSIEKSWKFYIGAFSTHEDDYLETRLNYRHRFDVLNTNTQVYSRIGMERTDSSVRSSMTWDYKRVNDLGGRYRWTTEGRIKTGDTEDESFTNNFEVDYSNRFTQVNASVRDHRAEESNTSVSGNIESAFNLTGDGLTITKPTSSESLLIVELASDTTASEVEVLVNNQPREKLVPGERTIIGLSAFKTYRVSIQPTEDADLISYDTASENFTLFPGNIVKKKWSLDKIFIGLGFLTDAYGNPLAWKRIKGLKEYVVTEETGFFQIEITGNERLYVELPSGNCYLNLPVLENVEYLHDFGSVQCSFETA